MEDNIRLEARVSQLLKDVLKDSAKLNHKNLSVLAGEELHRITVFRMKMDDLENEGGVDMDELIEAINVCLGSEYNPKLLRWTEANNLK